MASSANMHLYISITIVQILEHTLFLILENYASESFPTKNICFRNLVKYTF